MKKIVFLLSVLLFSNAFAQENSSFSQLANAPKANVGTSIMPLAEQTLQPDGSVGLAYDNSIPEAEDDKNIEPKPKQFKRMRAVEREYLLPTNTFGTEILNRIKVPPEATFQTSTMPDVQKAVRKENTKFVECAENDETCQNYEVDDAGEVIWK